MEGRITRSAMEYDVVGILGLEGRILVKTLFPFLDPPVMLAPMAGVTDKVFHCIVREFGCGLIFTEMLNAKALCLGYARAGDAPSEWQRPIFGQLFGSDPGVIREAVQILKAKGFDGIDINAGCPVPKVVRKGEGAALMMNPRTLARIVEEAVKVSPLPVSVKIRAGWDDETRNAPYISRILEDSGAAFVTVHARTRVQGYRGAADWSIIRAVRENVHIPVVGNGDIFHWEDAVRMRAETGCDAVMVARGALGRPWLPSMCIRAMMGEEPGQPPAPAVRLLIALRHAKLLCQEFGEDTGIRKMRKHMCYYTRGLPGSAAFRPKVMKAATLWELQELVRDYIAEMETDHGT